MKNTYYIEGEQESNFSPDNDVIYKFGGEIATSLSFPFKLSNSTNLEIEYSNSNDSKNSGKLITSDDHTIYIQSTGNTDSEIGTLTIKDSNIQTLTNFIGDTNDDNDTGLITSITVDDLNDTIDIIFNNSDGDGSTTLKISYENPANLIAIGTTLADRIETIFTGSDPLLILNFVDFSPKVEVLTSADIDASSYITDDNEITLNEGFSSIDGIILDISQIAEDPDGDTISYAFATDGNSDGLFTIDSSTGIIKMANGKKILNGLDQDIKIDISANGKTITRVFNIKAQDLPVTLNTHYGNFQKINHNNIEIIDDIPILESTQGLQEGGYHSYIVDPEERIN